MGARRERAGRAQRFLHRQPPGVEGAAKETEADGERTEKSCCLRGLLEIREPTTKKTTTPEQGDERDVTRFQTKKKTQFSSRRLHSKSTMTYTRRTIQWKCQKHHNAATD